MWRKMSKNEDKDKDESKIYGLNILALANGSLAQELRRKLLRKYDYNSASCSTASS